MTIILFFRCQTLGDSNQNTAIIMSLPIRVEVMNFLSISYLACLLATFLMHFIALRTNIISKQNLSTFHRCSYNALGWDQSASGTVENIVVRSKLDPSVEKFNFSLESVKCMM
jgi:hypothetical protein